MKQLLINNRYFLWPYLISLIVFVVFALMYTRTEMHIMANQFNAPFFDIFFKYATHLGDGTMIAILTLILVFVKYRFAVTFLIGSLLTSGIVHLFKRLLLEEMYRPSKYFELFESHQLYFVEGITLRSLQTFPSGHASTAFNVFFMLALLTKNNYLKLFCFFIAFIVAYSRVYLSQHFFVDIAVGSFIATLMIFISYYQSQTWDKKWLDSSVIQRLQKRK